MMSNKVDMSATLEKSPKPQDFDLKVWGWSVISVAPWAINVKDKFKMPTFFNKKLKKHARESRLRRLSEPTASYSTVRFRPYVSKEPWHTGARAFLSQFFPRYGHYCGPNWSSGKDGGSLLWDKRPIDWLDYCCYCHDMGYDTHDQAELLKADLAFLECLERPHMATKGDIQVAHVYKTMCTSGLRSILIPYRQHLVKLKSGQLYLGFGWLSNMKWKGWNPQK
nr:phospholipase A2 domain-containing protein [Tanacetum cinerariifolium]